MEQTFADMTTSVDKLFNHLSINNIIVPKFEANKDVFDFLAEFEAATSVTTDEQKAQLLLKAFPVGRSKAWFETTLKPAVKADTPWPELKRKVIERFSDIEDRDRHFHRLREAQFKPETGQKLLDFVEELAYSFKKAHSDKFDEAACLKFIKAAIPAKLTPILSLIPGYKETRCIGDLTKVAKQYDTTHHYSENLEFGQKLNVSELTSLLKELIKKSDTTQSVVAALQTKFESKEVRASPRPEERYHRSPSPNRRSWQPKPSVSWQQDRQPVSPKTSPQIDRRERYSQAYRDNYRPSPERYRDSSPNRYRNHQYDQSKSSYNRHDQKPEPAFDDALYYERFGRPPNPCGVCKKLHWERHCPYNLK